MGFQPKIKLMTMTFTVDITKLLFKNVVYTFEKVTEKGYCFVDANGGRLGKSLMYPSAKAIQYRNMKVIRVVVQEKIGKMYEQGIIMFSQYLAANGNDKAK